MNRKDVIKVLKMENDLITFDPHTGEEIDVRCLNDLNKKCYIAHEEAIDFLRQSIPVEWIEKQMAERENYGDFNTAAAIGYLLLSWEEANEHKESD